MENQKDIGVERRERTHGVRFDNTINLGHILTFLGFLVTIMVTWSTLDKRVVVLEESRKAQAVMDSAQDLRSAEKFTEIRDTLSGGAGGGGGAACSASGSAGTITSGAGGSGFLRVSWFE